METKPRHAIRIVGAGFSGLTLAYYLNRLGIEVEVYERAPTAGGILQSLKTPYGLVENAANALMNSPELEVMSRDIGLELFHAESTAKARYIFRGRPRRIPFLISEFLTVVVFIFRMFFRRQKYLPRPLESIRAWGGRLLSKSLSFYTLETALQGVYAGDPERLSASLILRTMLSPQKSQVKYKRGSVAPLGGLAEFSEKMLIYLQNRGVKFFFNYDFKYKPNGIPVVIAVPAYEAAKILETEEPLLAQQLNSVEYLPVITANLFLKASAPHMKGFGCLFPPEASNLVLGVLFNQCIFKARAKNALSENWILGGARVKDKKEFLALSDHEVMTMVLKKRKELFADPADQALTDVLDIKIKRWDRAFPHYTIQLEALLVNLKSSEKIILHGNYLGQLGLTKILNQSATVAQKLADQMEKE